MGMVTPAGRGVVPLWEMCREQTTFIDEGLGRCLDIKASPDSSIAEQMALLSIYDAMENAGWSELNVRDGFVLATTTGLACQWERGLIQFIQKQLSEDAFSRHFALVPLGNILQILEKKLNFPGRTQLVTTACAAGIHAISVACLWLRSGLVDRCLVGGVEALCELTCEGFRSLQLLSKSRCRPFDAHRTGINLAEGGAFLCLETEPSRAPLAIIEGTGSSLDAYHMTSPEPQGKGCLRAIGAALENADLHPDQIDWIHAHGTGSLHNDRAEAAAIESLFSTTLTIPPVTSTKATHGHFLAATGIVEVALIVESLQRQQLLPTANYESCDPNFALPILTSAPHRKLQKVLKNTLGFGGSNGALVVSKV
jgi:3-oxoacyl-(acyl-carrier-protein) synthase